LASSSSSSSGSGSNSTLSDIYSLLVKKDKNITSNFNYNSIGNNEFNVSNQLNNNIVSKTHNFSFSNLDTSLFSLSSNSISANHFLSFSVLNKKYNIDLKPFFSLASLISVFLLLFAGIFSSRIIINAL